MVESTHLQDGQVGDFIFFEFLLGHFVFLLLWAVDIYHYLVWFRLCGYLVAIVRLHLAAEMRRDLRLPLSLALVCIWTLLFKKKW